MTTASYCNTTGSTLKGSSAQNGDILIKCKTISSETVLAAKNKKNQDLARCISKIIAISQEKSQQVLHIFLNELEKAIIEQTQILNKRVELQLSCWSAEVEYDIVQRIGFLATMALLEANLARKTAFCYPFTHQQAMVTSGTVLSIMKLEFRTYRSEVARSLGLLLGAVIKCGFTHEDRLLFKPNIFRMLETVKDSTVRYWYVVSLYRLVEQNNVTLKEMEIHNIYEAMIDCLNKPNITKEVKYIFKIIAAFAQVLGHESIDKFYQHGLLERILYFMQQAPKATYNFLEKLHGTDFSKGFPNELTEIFLKQTVDFDPATQLNQLKLSLKVGRHRLAWLIGQPAGAARQLDLITPLEQGLIEKLCYIVRMSNDIKLKQLTYHFIKELLVLMQRAAPEILPLIVNKMVLEGLCEQIREDGKYAVLRPVAFSVLALIDAGDDNANDYFDIL